MQLFRFHFFAGMHASWLRLQLRVRVRHANLFSYSHLTSRFYSALRNNKRQNMKPYAQLLPNKWDESRMYFLLGLSFWPCRSFKFQSLFGIRGGQMVPTAHHLHLMCEFIDLTRTILTLGNKRYRRVADCYLKAPQRCTALWCDRPPSASCSNELGSL